MKLFGLLLSLVAVVSCGPVVSQDESVLRFMVSNFVDCANNDFGLCLKEQALKATERLGTVRKLKILDGVTLLNPTPKEARSLDNLPAEPEERNKKVTEKLWSSASDLLQRSELELSFAGEEEDDTETRALGEVEEGRGKKKELKKKLKVLIPLILLAKAKAVALIVISIVIIAVSFAKLALLAKLAFLFKAFSIIKALLAKKHQQHDEGWAPHVEESHGGGHGWESGGGWSRSKNDASNMAYSAYRK